LVNQTESALAASFRLWFSLGVLDPRVILLVFITFHLLVLDFC
jgi:hypothetical protein